jgi:very-short-patch-repair endonuclease
MLKPSRRQRTAARASRAMPTPAEAAVWRLLRGRGLGWKFRRQAPVGRHTADFFCPGLRLIVELDGGVHVLRTVSDAARDAWLKEAGYTVLRFDNAAVLTNPNLLLEAIHTHAARIGAPGR